MIRTLDRSARLSALIKWISLSLAAKRGLPVFIAIALTIISLIVHIIWVETGNITVGIIGFVILHLAILIGFLGVLLSEPLGRG